MPVSTQFIGGTSVSDIGAPAASVLRAPPEPRFDLYFIPGSYSIQGAGVRPQLKKLIHQAGVDNVVQLPDGRIDVTQARAIKQANKGAIFLKAEHCPASMTPDGQPGYLRRYQAAGGPLYCEAWRRPAQRGTRTIWQSDEEGYHAWLDYLMVTGVIPEPDEVVYQDLLDRVSHRQNAIESRRNQGARIEQAAQHAAKLRAAVESAQEQEAAPAPAPKRRTRKAKVTSDG